MYLLDTNIVSDARRQMPQVVDWLRSIDPQLAYLSVITLGEITRGIAQLARKDADAASALSVWFSKLKVTHKDRTLAIDDLIAIEWGRLSALRTRGEADGLIAATAKVHGFILVTRNTRDFEDTGVALINPWQ
jgi:toxin FitB